jgi:hypothetical protein
VRLPLMAAAAGGRYCTSCRRLMFPGKGAPVKDRTEAFDRLACEPGAPFRAHADPVVSPSVHQATRERRAAHHQELEDQVESEKGRLTARSSATLPRPAVEELLSAPLWPRHLFGKMPQTCRVACRNLMIELILEFVNVDIDQPDAECGRLGVGAVGPVRVRCTDEVRRGPARGRGCQSRVVRTGRACRFTHGRHTSRR